MVKIVSPRAELVVLRGMLQRDKRIAGTLLSQVDETYFHSEESLEIYDLIRKHAKDSGESPTYRLLLQDPDLTSEAKTFLKSASGDGKLETVEEARKAARILNKYRQNRGLYNIASAISEKLQSKKLDAEKLLDEVSSAVTAVRSGKATTDSFFHFGRKNNTIGLIRDLLYGENTDTLIPTGIEPFDEMAGGLPRGGLMTIGASTGGGKSVSASALAIYMASKGYKVLLVPLEMSTKEMAARITANVTKTHLSKVIQQKWEPGEAEVVEKKMVKWMKKVKKKGGQYTIFKPPVDVSIDDIFASIATYEYDVCIVDYIGLLKGASGDDQWQALGAIARQAKINAEINNRVNILLCQVSEEGKIRYARSIAEHSNNCIVGSAWIETDKGLTRMDALTTDHMVHVGKSDRYVKVHNFLNQGTKPVYRVTYGGGFTLEGTKDHRVRVLDADGQLCWKEIGKLTVEDHVVMPRQYRWVKTNPRIDWAYTPKTRGGRTYKVSGKIPKRVTDDFALWLGMWLGDGWLDKKGGVGFCARDKESIDLMVELFKTCFGVEVDSKLGNDGVYRVSSYNAQLATFLSELCYDGKGNKAVNKVVPSFMYGATRSSVCAFMKGLFTTDGNKGANYGNGTGIVNFFNTSEVLAEYVQLMLMRMGIMAKRKVRANHGFGKEGLPLWTVAVAGHNNLEAFHRDIGFVQARKSGYESGTFTKRELMPQILLDKVRKHRRPTSLHNLIRSAKTGLPVDVLHSEEFMDWRLQPNPELSSTLRQIKKQDVRLLNVESVEYVGKKKVYDISVPDHHSFVANGMRVHNCWIWVATAESKETGITRIEQLKARNSATVPFYVKIDYAHMRMEGVKQEDMNNGDLGDLNAHSDDTVNNDDKSTLKKAKKMKDKNKKSKKERLTNLASDL